MGLPAGLLDAGYTRLVRPVLFRSHGGDPEAIHEQLISLLFSATVDIHATFPATVARARIPELADVPLMNMADWPLLKAASATL
mgnify:CR=1 FL=1